MSITNSKLETCHEAFAAFKRTQKIWGLWALYLIPLSAVGQLLNITAFDQNHLNPNLSATPIQGFLFSFIASMLAPYIFTGVYLKAEPIMAPVTINIGNYFYWLGHVFLKYFLGAFLPGAVMGIIGGVLAVVTVGSAIIKHAPMNNPALMLPFLLIVFAIFYLLIRLYCVGALAICRDASPLKTGWRLTKSRCWYLFGNGFVFSLKLLIYLFAAATFTQHRIERGQQIYVPRE